MRLEKRAHDDVGFAGSWNLSAREYEDRIEPAKCEGIAHRLSGNEIVFGLEILLVHFRLRAFSAACRAILTGLQNLLRDDQIEADPACALFMACAQGRPGAIRTPRRDRDHHMGQT